jgi:hypothetical protein
MNSIENYNRKDFNNILTFSYFGTKKSLMKPKGYLKPLTEQRQANSSNPQSKKS